MLNDVKIDNVFCVLVSGCDCVYIITICHYNNNLCYVFFQNLLCNPVLDGAVNTEAAALLRDSPDVYRQMVAECVKASLRIHGKILGHVSKI